MVYFAGEACSPCRRAPRTEPGTTPLRRSKMFVCDSMPPVPEDEGKGEEAGGCRRCRSVARVGYENVPPAMTAREFGPEFRHLAV